MLSIKNFFSNYSMYKKIAFQITVLLSFIFITFQLLVFFRFFDEDTLNVIHNHRTKINILFVFTLLFILFSFINMINKWFINPLKKLNKEINEKTNIFNNKNIHENNITDTFKYCTIMIDEINKKDFQVDLELSMLTKEKQAIMSHKQLTSSIFNNSQDIIIIIDNNGIITRVNPTFCKLIGVKYENLLHQPLINFINKIAYKNIKASLTHELNSCHNWQGEFTIQHLINKKNIPLYVKINKFIDKKNNHIQYSIIATDLTTIKEIDRLVYINHHDSLTELPNRVALTNRLNDELNKQRTECHKFAVVFIDLDNFKKINDNYGHQMGDKVLKITAYKLRNSVKKTDMVARLSGDEFIAIINPVTTQTDVIQTCERILNILQQPIIINNQKIAISASLGCYYAHPKQHQTIDDILSQADIAMYKAKMTGKGRIVECNSF
ncbi:Cyclic di-GMP phosphodiesterase Gmr [Photobacterium andalusiense]|uniref:Cyclic di-GMP phosphodiesterase Gmr n=2 Tax=Photobacterium andalusiense TaxID=2204296 RepID=A0A1Y6MI52_9GAMM|nr:Cyclic di-GMP phosphodiesterase Gmr [Photobacterium andalusiense]